jgi:hypothetical protein
MTKGIAPASHLLSIYLQRGKHAPLSERALNAQFSVSTSDCDTNALAVLAKLDSTANAQSSSLCAWKVPNIGNSNKPIDIVL